MQYTSNPHDGSKTFDARRIERPRMTSVITALLDNPALLVEMQQLQARIREERKTEQRAWQSEVARELRETDGFAHNVARVASQRSMTTTAAKRRALEIEQLLEQLRS